MLNWLKKWLSSTRLNEQPGSQTSFRAEWTKILVCRVAPYARLPAEHRRTLHRLIERFIEEKTFWGAEGLEVTDEMRLLVAAQACLLILHLPEFWVYPKTKEIIMYPQDFGEVVETIGPDGRRYDVRDDKIGETWNRGPVLLSWSVVRNSGWIDARGHNVVYHEFAHALDWLDGVADGTPPLGDKSRYEVWRRVMTSEYKSLVFADRNGRRAFLDTYGASNPAEFFAVATEQFFEAGARFRRIHPALYAQLRGFYKHDPANW